LALNLTLKIILTETIDDLVKVVNVEALLAQNFNPATNIQYDLVDKQVKLSALDLKAQKAMALPSLSGIYSTSTSGMAMKMSDLKWYPSFLSRVEILSYRYLPADKRLFQYTKRRRLILRRPENTKEMISDQLQMQGISN